MNTELIVLLTVVICLTLFAVVIAAVRYMSKHGVTAAGLTKVETGITLATSIATAIKPFLPGYADSVIDAVLKYAQEGVTRAEATYKAALAVGVNANDVRSTEAATWIKGSLAMEGVKVTPDVQKLIDAVTPIFVKALPPTHAVA